MVQSPPVNKSSRIYVAGHRGLVGSSLVRRLREQGFTNLITRSHAELDLTDATGVQEFFVREQPEYVFLAAAKVGGIQANVAYPAEFIHTNLAIQGSVIHSAYLTGVKRLFFFGSNCAYPLNCPQPMPEECLLTGVLEPTSEPYALAKIAGIGMCQAYNRQYGTCFISLIPPTLYGANDNFNQQTSHVLAALLARFHQAKEGQQGEVEVWGSGTPRREFLYVDDLADACIFLLSLEESVLQIALQDSNWLFNVGTGEDLSIMELTTKIKEIVGFQGTIRLDKSRPDGAHQKLLQSKRINQLGWSPKVSLRQGLEQTYSWYCNTLVAVTDGP